MIINRNHIYLILLISFSLIITACQGNQKNKASTTIYQNTQTDLIKEIMNEVSQEYDINDDTTISEIGHYNNIDGFSAFSFKDKNGIIYEGNAYARIANDEWEVFDYNVIQIDQSLPFTTLDLGLKNAAHPESFFYISSGYIHDKRINEIRITYSNDLQQIIEISDDQKLYLDYQLGEDIYRKEIVGLNKGGNIIHQYP